MSEILKVLSKIQQDLKAPKGQYNSFSKYNYRSCEDILSAVKPMLGDAVITLSDEMVEVGGRVYVKATAMLHLGKEQFSVTAYARESAERKGMNSDQLTGATSSYARKYALNGLLLIDDTKDADSMDNRQQGANKPLLSKANMDKQVADFFKLDNDARNAKWSTLSADLQNAINKAAANG